MTTSTSLRNLALVGLLLLPLAGCFEKDSPQPGRTALLTAHRWHNSRYQAKWNDGRLWDGTDAALDSCTLDDVEIFYADHTLRYDSGENLCAGETERFMECTWEFRNNDQDLYRKYTKTGFAWQARIETLTEDSLVISYDVTDSQSGGKGRATLTYVPR